MTLTHTIDTFCKDQSDWDLKTERWYRRRLGQFVECLTADGVTAADQITLEHIKAHLTWLKRQGYAWNTRTGAYTCMSRFFRWLRDNHHIPINIFAEAGIKRPAKSRPGHRDLAIETIHAMIAAGEAETSSIAVRDVAIMRLLIGTGIRREELTRLKMADISLSGCYAAVQGKFDHRREVAFDDSVAKALGAWLVVRPETKSPELFTALHGGWGKAGNPLVPDCINSRLKHWQKKAGLPLEMSVSPHRWRHTYASEFIANGGDEFTLQVILGHTDIKTTALYVDIPRRVMVAKCKQFAPKIP